MNLYELNTNTLLLCKLPLDDADVRTENATLFLTAYNKAYERIFDRKLSAYTSEAVTLDANRCFDINSLTKDCLTVLHVTEMQDFSAAAGYARAPQYRFYEKDSDGVMCVPGMEAGDTAYVTYKYKPARLSYKEVLFNISGANTTVSIPIDEAITADMVDRLVGSKISVYDASTGLYTVHTIASVTIGTAGAAAIVVTVAPTTTADGDIIYSNENTEYLVASALNTPQMPEEYHDVLCYCAAYMYYMGRKGRDDINKAAMWKNEYETAYGKIRKNSGEKQEYKNLYSPEL